MSEICEACTGAGVLNGLTCATCDGFGEPGDDTCLCEEYRDVLAAIARMAIVDRMDIYDLAVGALLRSDG